MTTKSKSQDKHKMSEIDDNISKLFDIKKRLGKGAYGIVWKALDKRNNETIAVKKIFDAFRDETDAQRTFREIIFLKAFRYHPNIVKLHNVIRASNNLDIYLIFEYMESDLHNIIKKGTILKDIHKRYVMYQLINAIKYIHSGNVIHRDLKPSNVLIDSKCRCKLADFGLARSVSIRPVRGDPNDLNSDLPLEPLLTDYVATRWYRAPEILVASKRYTKGIDMWSLGCILGEMIRGKPLFQGSSTVNQIEKIVSTLPDITEQDIKAVGAGFGSVLLNKQLSKEKKTTLYELISDASRDALDLVKSLLVLDPLGRLTAKQALNHPYVEKFRNSIPEIELNVDVLPPFRDDVRLTVPEYRSKLYEIVQVTAADKKQSDITSKVVSNATKLREHKSQAHSLQDKTDMKKQTKLKHIPNRINTSDDKYQKSSKYDKNEMMDMQQLQNAVSNTSIINKSQSKSTTTSSTSPLIKRKQIRTFTTATSTIVSEADTTEKNAQSTNVLDERQMHRSKSHGNHHHMSKADNTPENSQELCLLNGKRHSISSTINTLGGQSLNCSLKGLTSSHRAHRSSTNLNKIDNDVHNKASEHLSYTSVTSPFLRQAKSEMCSSNKSPNIEMKDYERRLKKLEEEIKRYKNEVKTFCRETVNNSSKHTHISPTNDDHMQNTKEEQNNFKSTPKTAMKQTYFQLLYKGNHHDVNTSDIDTSGNSGCREQFLHAADCSSKSYSMKSKETNKYIYSNQSSIQRMHQDQQIRINQHRSRPISKFI